MSTAPTDVLDRLPRPEEIRAMLARTVRDADALRRLLRVSEQVYRDRGERPDADEVHR